MSYARGDDLQQKTEDLVEKADAFVEENQELVGDAGPDTLGRILVHAAPIVEELTEQGTVTARLYVEAANALADALNSKTVKPKEIYKLEMHHKLRENKHERVDAAITRLLTFTQAVQELKNVEESVPIEEVAGAKASPEKPKSLWRKLFG